MQGHYAVALFILFTPVGQEIQFVALVTQFVQK